MLSFLNPLINPLKSGMSRFYDSESRVLTQTFHEYTPLMKIITHSKPDDEEKK